MLWHNFVKQVLHSGFLSDYSGFKPGSKSVADVVYVKSAVDWNSHDKIVIWYSPDAA